MSAAPNSEKTAWTPGPWRVGNPPVSGPSPRHIHVSGPTVGSGVVARLLPKREADARLISAAPDLYEALAEVRRVGDDKLAFRSEWVAAVAKADAALAKARGEQP